MTKILVKKDCNIGDNSKKHLKDFIKVAKDFLKINLDFSVKLIGERESDSHTTAYYSPMEKLVVVKTNNRSLVDIMRSIAHEMVHHKQFQNDELVGDIPDIGGKIEDDANALAGQIIKIYAKNFDNKDIYDMLITENQEVKTENYETAMSDKKTIDEITNAINEKISLWCKNSKKEYNDIFYEKEDKKETLEIILGEYGLKVILDNSHKGGMVNFDSKNDITTLTIEAKFSRILFMDYKIKYNSTVMYHELQHYVDDHTKYAGKVNIVTKNYKQALTSTADYPKYKKSVNDYMTQPIEFNAWFTASIMPFLEKNKDLTFNETIRRLYVFDDKFKAYFDFTDKPTHQRFLKRAYKYWEENSKETQNENYEVAMSDKKKIEEIINKVNILVKKWFNDDKKDSEFIKFSKNQPKPTKSNILNIGLSEHNLVVKFTDNRLFRLQGEFRTIETHDILTIKGVFLDNEINYDANTMYHELQHKVDDDTKYKDKEVSTKRPIDSVDDYDKYEKSYQKYMSQPKEFNAWFTSIIMPFLEKNKGISFNEMIRKLYEEDKDFVLYFENTDKLTHQRFLKRAYKYWEENNKQPQNENYEVAMSDKKEIEEITNELKQKLYIWSNYLKKNKLVANTDYNVSDDENHSIRYSLKGKTKTIIILLFNRDISFHLISDGKTTSGGSFNKNGVWSNINLYVDINKNKVDFNETSLYHELQHIVDFGTKYKDKHKIIYGGYQKPTDDGDMNKYLSQPVEFNAWFTANIIPALDDYKGLSFKLTIRSLYEENEKFKFYFDNTDEATHQRFLKRAYKYYIEHNKEVQNENYDVAMSDKTKIESWIKQIDDTIEKWLKNGKKDFENVEHEKYKNYQILSIFLDNGRINIKLNSDYTGGEISFNPYHSYRLGEPTEDNPFVMIYDDYHSIITVEAKFNKYLFKKDTLTYDYTCMYHELQHNIDYLTKYLYKSDKINKNYKSALSSTNDYNKYKEAMNNYMSQPIEFNAWFTSTIMPFLEKNKGLSFNETIKKLYKDNTSFNQFFYFTDKTMQQRFLKRAYKYYQEHNKQSDNK